MQTSLGPLARNATVYVAGHAGLAGSALVRHLKAQGFTRVVGARSAEVDLRDSDATRAYFHKIRPDVVIDAAARVGGILANSTYPVEFLGDNLRIQLNLFGSAHEFGVGRLLFLGSSCIYPKFAPQPISEDSLLTGPLEESNDAYAIAKIVGVQQVGNYRKQYGHAWISVMPANLYGTGDNFDLESAHVLPALIRKIHEAVVHDRPTVVLWGSGTPRREFLHADDLASACLYLLEHYDHRDPVNVGIGEDLSILELAKLVADVAGFRSEFVFDTTKPDGTPRKLLDTSRLNTLGWKPSIGIADGVTKFYRWFVENVENIDRTGHVRRGD